MGDMLPTHRIATRFNKFLATILAEDQGAIDTNSV
jgi:hypothetical protein